MSTCGLCNRLTLCDLKAKSEADTYMGVCVRPGCSLFELNYIHLFTLPIDSSIAIYKAFVLAAVLGFKPIGRMITIQSIAMAKGVIR